LAIPGNVTTGIPREAVSATTLYEAAVFAVAEFRRVG